MSLSTARVLAVVGAACAAYGLKFVLSETKMRFHFFWFGLAAVLVAPAALMSAGLWGAVPLALQRVVAAGLLLFAAYEAVVGAAIARHSRDRASAGLDYVVVLGAQVLDGTPGHTFQARLDTAGALLAANPRLQCIVCGGQGAHEAVSESQAGRDYLVARGIEASRILLENRSHSTSENLRFAVAFVDPARDAVGVVTSDFHVARALALARRAGLRRASGVAVRSSEFLPLNNIVRESFALIKDLLLDRKP